MFIGKTVEVHRRTATIIAFGVEREDEGRNIYVALVCFLSHSQAEFQGSRHHYAVLVGDFVDHFEMIGGYYSNIESAVELYSECI